MMCWKFKNNGYYISIYMFLTGIVLSNRAALLAVHIGNLEELYGV